MTYKIHHTENTKRDGCILIKVEQTSLKISRRKHSL